MKRFNALDVFICLAIFAAVTAAGLYLGGNVNNPVMASEQKTVYFTVEIMHTQNNFADKIKLGDTIEDSVKGYYYGVVSDIAVEPTRIPSFDADAGVVIRAEVPERETICLTVKCNGTESDTEIAAEGQVIKIGKKMTLKGKGYAVGGYISEIRTE